MRRWLLLVSMLALAACNPQPVVYTPVSERNFVTACEAGASSRAVCDCVWDRIESEISASDFAALERLPQDRRDAHPLMTQINGYMEACSVTVTPPATLMPGDEVPAP